MSSPMYGAGDNGLTVLGDYDPKITPEVDAQIRNMPVVVNYIYKKAAELLKQTGSDNFEIVLSTQQGAEASNAQRQGLYGGKHVSRKVVWDRQSKAWGQDIGTSQHGRETQRPRAYVMPANGEGIHEELSEGVLLKAALGMAGK